MCHHQDLFFFPTSKISLIYNYFLSSHDDQTVCLTVIMIWMKSLIPLFVILTVSSPPPLLSPSVSVSASPSADLQLGSEATLQCQVKGLMPEYAVQWERPGGSPHITSQVVQLKSVARSDAGAWNCTFSYDEMTYSESLNIKVKGKTLTSTKVFVFVFYHNKSIMFTSKGMIYCVFAFRPCYSSTCTSHFPGRP